MFGLNALKQKIEITDSDVECPVKGCTHKVMRQRDSFIRDDKFCCPNHKIIISPSTFEYYEETDNLLWKQTEDLELLKAIKTVKRESRIARDNSEDALTWNVFRYLERSNLTERFLTDITTKKHDKVELIYWAYSQKTGELWDELREARYEFEKTTRLGSEPDLIALTEHGLFFVEAKLNASNKVQGSIKHLEKYTDGGKSWLSEVFNSTYKTIAVDEKKYELLRFWLLGSWIASRLQVDFYLINLVRDKAEINIEQQFKPYIKTDNRRQFKRISWEYIYDFILTNAPDNPDKSAITEYFENKTIGYAYASGKLRKAFQIKV